MYSLARATMALPNGYCGLPLQQTCPHANACLTCPMFLTTPDFLPQHHAQRQQTLELITAAEARLGNFTSADQSQKDAAELEQLRTKRTTLLSESEELSLTLEEQQFA